jgi:hypothetical protein
MPPPPVALPAPGPHTAVGAVHAVGVTPLMPVLPDQLCLLNCLDRLVPIVDLWVNDVRYDT